MSGINLHNLSAVSADLDSIPLEKTLLIMGNSVILGILLMMIGIWVANRLKTKPLKPGGDLNTQMSEIVLGAGNYLFLTIGMTVVMVLVNNNLARAFAIGAAISLVRLRIKVDGKGQGTTLLMAVLVGMACGVDKIIMAWCLMLTYAVLQTIIVSYVTACNNKRVHVETSETVVAIPREVASIN